MGQKSARAERRTDALSRARVVDAAIALLDSRGESGLTFRALAERLSTGAGAIYWHVANKSELVGAATDAVIASALTDIGDDAAPADAIRTLAVGLFEAIDAHPWAGAHLAHEPWQSAMRQIFERVGQKLQALRVPRRALFFTVSALVSYILGVAGQNAAAARNPAHGGDRDAFLESIATEWSELDPAEHPFLRLMAKSLRSHDDQEQFLAGIDLILAGVATVR